LIDFGINLNLSFTQIALDEDKNLDWGNDIKVGGGALGSALGVSYIFVYRIEK
jgi:hypothetical protein